MALDFIESLSDDVTVRAGNLELSNISKNGRIWTFTPNDERLETSGWLKNKKLWFVAYFDNMKPEDIKIARQAAILYFRFKMPDNSASCLIDRFDLFPL